MPSSYSYVSSEDTGYFSRLVCDYLNRSALINPFFAFDWGEEGLDKAISERSNYPVNRGVLVDTLRKQYETLELHPRADENLALLANENTYTICTAHQPNLLTGYLYFIYKILHAIKMADTLNIKYPDKKFVPVYYMGSEDNDLDELGVFRFRGDKYRWDGNGQSGAVGRMSTTGLKPLLDSLFKVFGPPGSTTDKLQDVIIAAYLKHKTIGAATQYLVNELFGKFGLIVLDPDEAAFKKQFIPVMEDELLHQNALPILSSQIDALGEHYKIQAHPRAINLFYLNEQLRERIETKGERWVVVNTDISWGKEELLFELNEHPERFSPNVMLRGLYQETILPDVAFIGGGAEVAYWMQLKSLFQHYKGFLPVIYLRQSVLIESDIAVKLQAKLGISDIDLFKQNVVLEKEFVERHSNRDWHTSTEMEEMVTLMDRLKQKATHIDATLQQSADASIVKISKQFSILEQKMLRAEKKKLATDMERVAKLKALLFPNGGLQERVDNFMEYYLEYDETLLDDILEGILPFSGQFMLLKCK